MLFHARKFYNHVSGSICAAACIYAVIGMCSGGFGSFSASLFAVFSFFAQGYGGGAFDTHLLLASYTLYHADCLRAAWNTCFCCVSRLRNGRLLSVGLRGEECAYYCFHGDRGRDGQVQISDRRHAQQQRDVRHTGSFFPHPHLGIPDQTAFCRLCMDHCHSGGGIGEYDDSACRRSDAGYKGFHWRNADRNHSFGIDCTGHTIF